MGSEVLACELTYEQEVRNELFRGRGFEHSSRGTAPWEARLPVKKRPGSCDWCVLGNGDGEWRPGHRTLRTPAHALSVMGSLGQRRDIYLTLFDCWVMNTL